MANTSPSPYRVVAFLNDKTHHPLEFPFVKSIFYLHKYLNGANPKGKNYDYHYMNIYNRKTGRYLGRQYFDNYIIDKPNY